MRQYARRGRRKDGQGAIIPAYTETVGCYWGEVKERDRAFPHHAVTSF